MSTTFLPHRVVRWSSENCAPAGAPPIRATVPRMPAEPAACSRRGCPCSQAEVGRAAADLVDGGDRVRDVIRRYSLGRHASQNPDRPQRHLGRIQRRRPGGGIQSHGRLLAAAGTDNMVRLWNPATGVQIRTLTGHTKEIFGVASSPDGYLLASGGLDPAVRL
jgi:hypothetical protein